MIDGAVFKHVLGLFSSDPSNPVVKKKRLQGKTGNQKYNGAPKWLKFVQALYNSIDDIINFV